MNHAANEVFVLLENEGKFVVHQTWGNGYVVVGEAASKADGKKIVAMANELVARAKGCLRDLLDEAQSKITEARELCDAVGEPLVLTQSDEDIDAKTGAADDQGKFALPDEERR